MEAFTFSNRYQSPVDHWSPLFNLQFEDWNVLVHRNYLLRDKSKYTLKIKKYTLKNLRADCLEKKTNEQVAILKEYMEYI